jgi:hypothetical protein
MRMFAHDIPGAFHDKGPDIWKHGQSLIARREQCGGKLANHTRILAVASFEGEDLGMREKGGQVCKDLGQGGRGGSIAEWIGKALMLAVSV